MLRKQRQKELGITLLLIVVVLLLISTLLIFFSTQYSLLQQKMISNFYANQQAFEAAEAGLEVAIPYLQANYSTIIANASGGYLQPYNNSNTQNVTLTNNSKYSFTFSNPTANNYQLITITSTGINADNSSTRVITQQIKSSGTTITTPTVTMTVQGDITLKNAASINNTQTNANILAGGSVTFENSAQTTTSAGTSSNSSQTGSDIQQNNSTLSNMSIDTFFQSVFGASQSTVKNAAAYTFTNNADTNYNSLNGVTNAVIWIDQTNGAAEISNATTMGSPTQPVVLIVNGNLNLKNSVTIYGLIFIMNSTSTNFQTNSVTVNGAVIATENFQFSNSATLNYNAPVLNALPTIGGIINYTKVPASWRDF